MGKEPKFKLGQKVKMKLSDEAGEVTGHAVYLENSDSFFVRYKDAEGCQREGWWNAEALEAAGE